MEAQFLIAGFGGQGVLLIGQLLAKAAMHEGMNVSWMPSYGPEMRGGEANCAVVISDEPIGSPLVTEIPIAVIMNKPSMIKFTPAMEKSTFSPSTARRWKKALNAFSNPPARQTAD